MKKWISLALLMVCVLSIASVPACGEEAKIYNEVALSKPLQLPDLMDLTINAAVFSKEEKYFGTGTNYATYTSGEGFRFLLVNCTLLNTALEYYKYDDYIKDVKLVFREKYEYSPTLLQNFPDKKYPTEALWEIQPLVSTTPIFFFKVPTLLETSLDPIYLYFTIGDVNYSCKLR